MTDRHLNDSSFLAEQLSELSQEIAQFNAVSMDYVLERVCDRLTSIAPFDGAGVFSPIEHQDTLRWLHLSGAGNPALGPVLGGYRSSLQPVVNGSGAVQLAYTNGGAETGGYLAGIPTGLISGTPAGLLVSSSRELVEDELGLLGPFALMVGLSAENARLSGMLDASTSGNPVARLLGLIAHELRTPLTAVRGNVQLALMAHRRSQQERVADRLESAISSVDGMTGLVQTLLDVSRLERGTFRLEQSLSDLRDTLQNAVTMLSESETGSETHLRMEPGDPVTISHDQRALSKAFIHVLEAVSRCAGDTNEIVLTLELVNGEVGVAVRYSGERLPERERAVLSEPLHNAHASTDRADDLSLELAYTRGVVQHHGGRITVAEAESDNDWHDVTIWLPSA